jgi:hypothetical protein
MYNEKKIKLLKKLGVAVAALLLFLTAFAIGSKVGNSKKEIAVNEAKKAQKVEKPTGLTEEQVNDFLVKYYTRKDLGENRNRYKPLMTDAMYTQSVTNEELPINQAYKGYTIDQVFTKSTNYIDQEHLTAICQVSYKNTQLQKLSTKKGALINQNNDATVQLTFIKQGDKYLVNNIAPVVLDIPVDTSGPNSYPTDDQSDSQTDKQADNQTNEQSKEKKKKKMSTYNELIAKKEKLVSEYERSKSQLKKQEALVRKREEAIQRLEGEIAVALITENGLTAEELAEFLSEMKPKNNNIEGSQDNQEEYE